MRICEKTGKTIDDAVNAALRELALERDAVEVEVLEEPSKGLLGILGNRLAKVRVTEKETPAEKVKVFMERLLSMMNVASNVTVSEQDEWLKIDINGEELGIVIGKRGQTLDALQYLTSIVANKSADKRWRVIVDAEGYRKRREDVLQSLAKRLAEKVRRSGDDIMLEPMSPQERRIIHSTLQKNPFVTTRSEGEEPFRKIIIAAKNK